MWMEDETRRQQKDNHRVGVKIRSLHKLKAVAVVCTLFEIRLKIHFFRILVEEKTRRVKDWDPYLPLYRLMNGWLVGGWRFCGSPLLPWTSLALFICIHSRVCVLRVSQPKPTPFGSSGTLRRMMTMKTLTMAHNKCNISRITHYQLPRRVLLLYVW